MSLTLKLILIGLLSISLAGCGGSTDNTDTVSNSNPVDPDPVDPDPVDPDPVDPDPVDPDPVDPDSVLLRFDEGRLNQSVLG